MISRGLDITLDRVGTEVKLSYPKIYCNLKNDTVLKEGRRRIKGYISSIPKKADKSIIVSPPFTTIYEILFGYSCSQSNSFIWSG